MTRGNALEFHCFNWIEWVNLLFNYVLFECKHLMTYGIYVSKYQCHFIIALQTLCAAGTLLLPWQQAWSYIKSYSEGSLRRKPSSKLEQDFAVQCNVSLFDHYKQKKGWASRYPRKWWSEEQFTADRSTRAIFATKLRKAKMRATHARTSRLR